MSNKVDNLIHVATEKLNESYVKNMKHVMTNHDFNSDIKYRIGIDIINTYFDLKKDLMIYKDSIIVYRPNIKIEEILNFKDYISKSFNEVFKSINVSNIEEYELFDHNNDELYETVELKNEERLEMFQELLEDLENFKNYQLELFDFDKFYLLRAYINKGLNYEATFKKILERYIERAKWIEKELMRIKYENYIGIEYSLSEATEKIYNTISEYNEIDDNALYNTKDGIIFDDSLKVYI